MIQEDLCTWYEQYHRFLIFRESRDPYAIWVSEIMAQQTRIDTMLPYYERWMARFPNVETLALANIDDVLKHWEGLGYYNRARNLQTGAKQVLNDFKGVIPSSISELLSIKGIGMYTAGAIASIAFNLPTPAVDGNVLRVMARFYELEEDVTKQKTARKVEAIVSDWMHHVQPNCLTQALMELGALICTPQNPRCESCPIAHQCLAYRNKSMMSFPVKSKAKSAKLLNYAVYLDFNAQAILLNKDETDGLMKGFYRLPMGEMMDKEPLFSMTHVFSHRIWHCDVYKMEAPRSDSDEWVVWEKLSLINLVTAHRKILAEAKRREIL